LGWVMRGLTKKKKKKKKKKKNNWAKGHYTEGASFRRCALRR
jgi:hypothetical protein